ncbi:MAG: SurA N-terminal domain-containing protein [Coriobacteriia bacterium]
MKSTRNLLIAALCGALLIGALGVSGCSNKNVVAKVNGATISTDSLNQQLEQLKKQYPNMFTGADGEGRLLDFKQRLLDNIINQKLVEQAAKDKGISVSDADVQKQIDQLRAGFKDQAQFDAALKSAGMTVEGLKTQIRNQLVTQKLIESLSASSKVSEADIQAYYDKNKDQFLQKAAKKASQILFKPEDKATAEKVLAQVKAGDDFGALAKKYSVDTASASKGGDLGYPTSAYVPEFQAALDKLKKGQTTSALVQTPFGWHIIRVTDERTAVQQPLAEVKTQIEQIIVQQRKADAYQTFLADLRKTAKIEILAPDLKAAGGSKTATATK